MILWVIICGVGLVLSFGLMLWNFRDNELELATLWCVIFIIHVLVSVVVVTHLKPDTKCTTYHIVNTEEVRENLTLCGNREVQFNGRTYRGPG